MNPRCTRVQVCATQKKLRRKRGGKLNHCYRFSSQMDLDSLTRVFNLNFRYVNVNY